MPDWRFGIVVAARVDGSLEAGSERSRTASDVPAVRFQCIGYDPNDAGEVTELAERVGMTKQGIGQFVTQLTRDGFLATESDPDDRRVRMVRRTQLGDDATHRLALMLQRLERDWGKRVGKRRYGDFRRVLDDIAGID